MPARASDSMFRALTLCALQNCFNDYDYEFYFQGNTWLVLLLRTSGD